MDHSNIYYRRELLTYSIEKRRIDLLTISSLENMLPEKEQPIDDLFPDLKQERPNKFQNKEYIFVTARVHPGEVQGSHMVNGLINYLLKEYFYNKNMPKIEKIKFLKL